MPSRFAHGPQSGGTGARVRYAPSPLVAPPPRRRMSRSALAHVKGQKDLGLGHLYSMNPGIPSRSVSTDTCLSGVEPLLGLGRLGRNKQGSLRSQDECINTRLDPFLRTAFGLKGADPAARPLHVTLCLLNTSILHRNHRFVVVAKPGGCRPATTCEAHRSRQ